MLKKTIFGLCLLLSFFSFGQESVKGSAELNELVLNKKNDEVRIDADAEKPAVFPLGITALKNMFSENFRVRKVITNTQQVSCELTFIIDKEGSMTDIKAFGNNESFNKEAIRTISKIKQKWIPAEINGQKARYRFKLPLTISFDKKDIH